MKNQKQLETVLYSSIGVVILLVIAIAVNLIFTRFSTRIDLTADRIYTLSEGTKNILSKLDTPVQLRFYFSQSAPDLDPGLRTYAQRVEDLLNEYRAYSKGKIEIKKLDPKPDSDAEDSATLDGIQGMQANPLGGDKIYFGIAVSCLDAKAALGYITPQRERLLEYDLTRAITQVIKPTKPTIGVMSGLPVMGEMNPMMMMRGGGRQEPWFFISELKADFNVKEVPLTTEKIDDDISVLVVVYPKGISEAGQYAIDQFVLRGGSLVAFLDPVSVLDTQASNPMNPLQGAANSGATLDKLLKTWGLEFDLNKVVSDKRFATELQGQNGRPQLNPSFLSIVQSGMNTNDITTAQLGRLTYPLGGAFTGSPADGLRMTVLFHSTPDSQLTDKMMAQFGATEEFKASGTEYKLGVRLEGKFKTAFPDGKPAAAKTDDDNKNEKETVDPAAQLKESKGEPIVVLIGDADLLSERFYAQIQNIFGQRIMLGQFAANLTFLQNLIEQLGGDRNLITIRSRATMTRPFTRVREMQAKAELAYESKIRQLEKDLSDAQQKINELQRAKAGDAQQAILSEEQKQEILKFQRRKVDVNKELKELRKNLRREVDSLETTTKWSNILGMPLAVSLAGIVIAVMKSKRTAAK